MYYQSLQQENAPFPDYFAIPFDHANNNEECEAVDLLAGYIKEFAELAKFRDKKVALFSLGGKTSNGAIDFTIEDAQNLLASAKKLKNSGYEIIFTNLSLCRNSG